MEYCVDNEWGTVCSQQWDDQNTAVVCAQLGFLLHQGITIITTVGFFSATSYIGTYLTLVTTASQSCHVTRRLECILVATSHYFVRINYNVAGSVTSGHNMFEGGKGPIFLSNVNCVGTERRLSDCQATTADCEHDQDIGVMCLPQIYHQSKH